MGLSAVIIKNTFSPHSEVVFNELARRGDLEFVVLYETAAESSRTWRPATPVDYPAEVLRSHTLDLRRLVTDAYVHLPRRPYAAIERHHPDVVIASGGGVWSSPANIAALLGRRRGRWAFVPWWGSFPRRAQSTIRRLADPWVRRFVGSGDAWLAYGTRAARELERLGADPGRVAISPNVARLSSAGAAAVATERSGEPRFLFVGQLLERKGLDVLLRAFERFEGGELWIAGDGPLSPLVMAAAARDRRIRVFGHLELEGVSYLYAQADVLVLPAYYEVWGLVVNEAMAFGLPVIASAAVGAIDDLIEHGVNGAVVRPGSDCDLLDAMRSVAAWSDERRRRAADASKVKLDAWSVFRAAAAIDEACRMAVTSR